MKEAKIKYPETMDFLEFINQSPVKFTSQITDLKEDIALLQYIGGTTWLPCYAQVQYHGNDIRYHQPGRYRGEGVREAYLYQGAGENRRRTVGL